MLNGYDLKEAARVIAAAEEKKALAIGKLADAFSRMAKVMEQDENRD